MIDEELMHAWMRDFRFTYLKCPIENLSNNIIGIMQKPASSFDHRYERTAILFLIVMMLSDD